VVLGSLLASLATLVTIASPASADAVSDKQAQAAQIAEQLDGLQRKQMSLEQTFDEANLKLDQANKDIAAAQTRVDQVSQEVDQHRAEVRLYAIQAYMNDGDGGTMDALLSAEGDKAPQKAGYLDAATNNRKDSVDLLSASKHKLDDQIAQLDQAKGDAQADTDQASQAKADNDDAVAEQSRIQSQIQGDLSQLVAQQQAAIAQQQAQANQAQLSALAAADANNPKPAANGFSTSTTGATSTTGSTGTTGTTARPAGPSAPAPAPTPAPRPTTPSTPAPTVPSSGKGAAAASIAMGEIGVPYVYGGASPAGFDCSGLVMWAYAQVGVSLPHPTTAQWAVTQPISMSQLQVGDLVFFYGLGHVGIYIGGGMVVHAPHTGDHVRTEAIANMPVDGARRVL
jgi:cell wall-associated NlpC family hydrolase